MGSMAAKAYRHLVGMCRDVDDVGKMMDRCWPGKIASD
jgi:hypothetical protein